jgi:hypothetical protein
LDICENQGVDAVAAVGLVAATAALCPQRYSWIPRTQNTIKRTHGRTLVTESASQIDETTLAQDMDHAMVTAAVHIASNTIIKRQNHSKLTVNAEHREQYNQLVTEHMLRN